MTGLSELWAQEYAGERPFWDGFDSGYIFEFAGRLADIGAFELGFRPAGSVAAREAADLIEGEMRSLGLQNVRQEGFPCYVWDFRGASLEVEGLGRIPASSYPPAPGTPEGGLESELVEVGHGTAQEYIGKDVRDKIAFVHLDLDLLPWMGPLAYEAELNGAQAVVFYYLNGYAQHESGEALNTHNGACRPTIPIINICRRDGERLAELLTNEGNLPLTLRSQVLADPEGEGLNVIGEIPGRMADRYLIVGAHYDAWFTGYWDNAIGVAGILAMAKTLLESGYQPEHTLVFVATDAEEFGAPDTHFDWLIGCHRMLEAHAEWHGRTSAAFNIDTLGSKLQERLGFAGPPELASFLRAALGGYATKAFPNPEVQLVEQTTAWTEVLTYAYFGIPGIQPRFHLPELRKSVYHTQFDDASLVDPERASETVQVYGALLVRFDQQPVLPFEFSARAHSLRATLEKPPHGVDGGELARLLAALDLLEQQAGAVAKIMEQAAQSGDDGLAPLNDQLREAAGRLVSGINYLSVNDPDEALPQHVYFERDLRALGAALTELGAGDAAAAISALTDPKTGVRGGSYARAMSYPVYHHQTVSGEKPGRQDLFWGQGRTAEMTDIWMELHTLDDKNAHDVRDYASEWSRISHLRAMVALAYRESLATLARVIEEVVALLQEIERDKV
jgi:hypothetical protein